MIGSEKANYSTSSRCPPCVGSKSRLYPALQRVGDCKPVCHLTVLLISAQEFEVERKPWYSSLNRFNQENRMKFGPDLLFAQKKLLQRRRLLKPKQKRQRRKPRQRQKRRQRPRRKPRQMQPRKRSLILKTLSRIHQVPPEPLSQSGWRCSLVHTSDGRNGSDQDDQCTQTALRRLRQQTWHLHLKMRRKQPADWPPNASCRGRRSQARSNQCCDGSLHGLDDGREGV